jgi:hypothetical protein
MRSRKPFFIAALAALGLTAQGEPTEKGRNLAALDGYAKRDTYPHARPLTADVKGYRCDDLTARPRILWEIEKPFNTTPVVRTFSRKGRITTTPKSNFSITRN